MNPQDIKGYGYDADPSRRPGIPRETSPRPLPHAKPPQRQQTRPAFTRTARTDRKMTPVFGSAQPPKGLSGAMRSFAYKYPSHLRRHWMLLLMADRVDVMEHRVGTLGGAATLASLFFAGGATATAMRGRRRRRAWAAWPGAREVYA
jgi:hypothetical protein